MTTQMARDVFHQQNGEVTKAYYAKLSAAGSLGEIGVALFRAQKRSSRAKDYRRGRYRAAAYDVKEWSLGEVCRLLTASNWSWGWRQDPNVILKGDAAWVLYVDIPVHGQVSFHSPSRMTGPEYLRNWDGVRCVAETRIIEFCDEVLPEGL